MAADNVKTAFRLPSGVNEDFIRNFFVRVEDKTKTLTKTQEDVV